MKSIKKVLLALIFIMCFWIMPSMAAEIEDTTLVGGRSTYQIRFADPNVTWNYKSVTFETVAAETYTGTAVTNPSYDVSDTGMTLVTEVANLKYNGNGAFDVFPKQGGTLTVKVTVKDEIFDGAIQDGHEIIAKYTQNFKITMNPYLTYDIRYVSSSGKVLNTTTNKEVYNSTKYWTPTEINGYTSPSGKNIVYDSLNKQTIDFVYNLVNYDISYTLDGGTLTGQKTNYNTEESYTLPTPTKTGYIFAGWTGSNSHTNPETSVTISSGSTGTKSYVANWNPITYKVVYNGNGNTSGSTAATTHTYNASQNLRANGFAKKYTVTYNYNYSGPSNTSATANYTFAGWAKSSTGSVAYSNGQSVINLTAVNNGTVNLYAKWNSKSVTLPNASRSGYTFGGWYTNSSCTNKAGDAGASYTPSSNVTLYAKWTVQNYTISYDLKGGSVSGNPTSYKVTSATFTLKNPTRSGYIFTGWTGSNGSTPSTSVTIASGSTGNKSYVANWVAIPATKTYSYTGSVQSYSVTVSGTYKLEVWGAQGGSGGYGGYSVGTKYFSKGTTIYIVVGQKGADKGYQGNGSGTIPYGGYNGGGNGGRATGVAPYGGPVGGGGGGGATHIATTNRGVLKNYSSYKAELLIVAGGGGGGANGDAGTGGGTSGGNATGCTGGSQTAGGTGQSNGSFGQGGTGRNLNWVGGGGGGGGYYGGASSSSVTGGNSDCGYSGAGGSGYTGGVNNGSMQNGIRSGNGYAQISYVG